MLVRCFYEKARVQYSAWHQGHYIGRLQASAFAPIDIIVEGVCDEAVTVHRLLSGACRVKLRLAVNC
jgi:hypothetical protein